MRPHSPGELADAQGESSARPRFGEWQGEDGEAQGENHGDEEATERPGHTDLLRDARFYHGRRRGPVLAEDNGHRSR